MKTTPILFITLFLYSLIQKSQDIVYTNYGAVLEGKIIEVNDNGIKMKRKENPDGPIYSIDKSSITKIQYNNGKTEIYENTNPQDNTFNNHIFDSIINRKKNIIGYDVAQFIYTSVGMSYERFFGKDAQFSIRIPLSIGFNYIGNENNLTLNYDGTNLQQDYFIYQKGKLAGGAIEFNYYPFKSKKFTYFVGPYFEYGVFAYKINQLVSEWGILYYNYNGQPVYGVTNTYQNSPLKYNGQHLAGGVTNGFLFHFNKIFTLTGTFGLGLKKDETSASGEKILTQARFNLIFGIRF